MNFYVASRQDKYGLICAISANGKDICHCSGSISNGGNIKSTNMYTFKQLKLIINTIKFIDLSLKNIKEYFMCNFNAYKEKMK